MTPKPPACVYRLLEGGIKEFVLTEVSRRAVDELFDIADALSRNDISTFSQPTLIDSRVGVPPVNHSLVRLRAMMANAPDVGKMSVALIFPQDPLLNVVAFISRSILPVRLYKPNERDMALEWLRSTIEARR